jgi:DNA-binding transcriptional LysR family regulator
MFEHPSGSLPVTLRQITGFLVAADLLSFTRAADRLHMTQPAFSQLIRELETALGLRLFDRSTRKIALTDFGEAARARLEKSLGLIREVCHEARAFARLESGHLAIGTLQSTAIGIVTDALGVLKQRAPSLTISLHEDFNGALLDRLVAGDFELAICARSTISNEIDFSPLFTESFVAVVPAGHPAAGRRWFDWSSLGTGALIVTTKRSSTREQVFLALEASGVQIKDSYEVENMFTAMNMVRAGLGVTFVPETVLPNVPRSGVAVVRVRNPSVRRTIGIARLRDHTLSPAGAQFVNLLRATIERHAERSDANLAAP